MAFLFENQNQKNYLNREGLLILITVRCNMLCGHCAIDAGPHGEDMELRTFIKLTEKISQIKERQYILIEGGEPTLHPLFWEFVDIILKATRKTCHVIQVTTNGSITESALKLLTLAKQKKLKVLLSYDKYHNRAMVEKEVVKGFREFNNFWAGITGDSFFNTLFFTSAAGRAKSWGVPRCCWDNWTIEPSGLIFRCGCRVECVGSVYDERNFLGDDWGHCSRYGDNREFDRVYYEAMRKALPKKIIVEIEKARRTGAPIPDEILSQFQEINNNVLREYEKK